MGLFLYRILLFVAGAEIGFKLFRNDFASSKDANAFLKTLDYVSLRFDEAVLVDGSKFTVVKLSGCYSQSCGIDHDGGEACHTILSDKDGIRLTDFYSGDFPLNNDLPDATGCEKRLVAMDDYKFYLGKK